MAKIDNELKADLKAAIDQLTQDGEQLNKFMDRLESDGRGGNVYKRFRWGVFWSLPSITRQPLMKRLYAMGCNDNHLDRFLAGYVKSLDNPRLVEQPKR